MAGSTKVHTSRGAKVSRDKLELSRPTILREPPDLASDDPGRALRRRTKSEPEPGACATRHSRPAGTKRCEPGHDLRYGGESAAPAGRHPSGSEKLFLPEPSSCSDAPRLERRGVVAVHWCGSHKGHPSEPRAGWRRHGEPIGTDRPR